MNKKLFFICLPLILLPYLILFALALIFFSPSTEFFNVIMHDIFRDNIFNLIGALLLYCLLSLVLAGICCFVSIYKDWDALAVSKTAMIIKLIQAPAYFLIFALGVLFVIAIWTAPFSFALYLLDCVSVCMTGLLVIPAVVNALKNKIFTFKEIFWVILLQSVFCADVVATIVLYIKLKKSQTPKETFDNNLVSSNI